MKHLVVVLTLGLLVAGCSTNPRAIEPNELERFDAEYSVEREWRSRAGRGVRKENLVLRPAVIQQQVFAGDTDGRIYAFERDSGKRLWRKTTDDRVSAGFYAGFGVVLYGTREGHAVARSIDDGSELWRTPLSSEILAMPTASADRAFFLSQDGRLNALSLTTGEPLWQFEAQLPILRLRSQTQPQVQGNRVYLGLPGGRLLALDVRNGVPIWDQRIAEPQGRSELDRIVDVGPNLILQAGGVFAVTFQGQAVVADDTDGRIYWAREMSSATPISAQQGVLFVADDTANVRALDMRSGQTLWQQDALYGRRLTGTSVADGTVLVGDFEGYLHWLDASDGTLVARRRHDRKGFAGNPVSFDDTFYVLGNRGRLSAYRLTPR